MTRRSSFFISLLVLILILVALSPWLAGLMFKRHFYRLVDTLNADPSMPMTIEILQYRLGWFTSDTSTQVSLRAPLYPNAGPSSATITYHIAHGPVVKNSITRRLAFAYGKIDSVIPLEKILPNQQLTGVITINTLANFGGYWQNYISIPNVTLALHEQTKVMLQQLTGTVNYKMTDAGINKYRVNLKMNNFLVQESNAQFSANNIKVQSKGVRDSNNLWTDHRQINIESLSFQSNSLGNTNIKNIALTSAFTASSATAYNLAFRFSTQAIQTTQKIFYLPNITATQFYLGLNNLNAQALSSLMNLNKRNAAADRQESLRMMFFLLPKLITNQSSIDHTIQIDTSDGPLNVKAHFYWPTIDQTYFPLLFANTNYKINIVAAVPLVNKVITTLSEKPPVSAPASTPPNGTVTTNTPTPTAPEHPVATTVQAVAIPTVPQPTVQPTNPGVIAKQYLDRWIQAGYVLVEKNNYIMNITREQNSVLINGKQFDPTIASPTMNLQQTPTPGATGNQPATPPDKNVQPVSTDAIP